MWTVQILNVSKLSIMISDDRKTLWTHENVSARMLLPETWWPLWLKWCSWMRHLGCRSFTSVTMALHLWFKLATLSCRKLPSPGENFCTTPSHLWFTAAKLGWWLLMPSSRSCDRAQLKINSTTRCHCADVMNPPKYCSINLSVRETSSCKDTLWPWKGILKQLHYISRNTQNGNLSWNRTHPHWEQK
jgi:hypothetical protein